MTVPESGQQKDKTARITAIVAIVVALIGAASSSAVAVYTTSAQRLQSEAGSLRTERMKAYAAFNAAEIELQIAVDAYMKQRTAVFGALNAEPPTSPDIEGLKKAFKHVEDSYPNVQRTFSDVLMYGSKEIKDFANDTQSREQKRVELLSGDVAYIVQNPSAAKSNWTGLELVDASRGVTTPVPRVYLLVSLTEPGSSGSSEPTRLCRGCSHLPRRSPARLPAASPHRYDGRAPKVSHLRPIQQRLVAHQPWRDAALERHPRTVLRTHGRTPRGRPTAGPGFGPSLDHRLSLVPVWPTSLPSGAPLARPSTRCGTSPYGRSSAL